MADHRFTVRRAAVAEVLLLRHTILRAGLPPDSAHFAGDDEPESRHWAAVSEAGEIIGCCTLLSRPWQNQPGWQLRGMAVATDWQRSGVGAALLTNIHQAIADTDRPLWCNARLPAEPFYRRHGWARVGGVFDILDAGPHVQMLHSKA